MNLDLQVRLAVSLHAADDKLRSSIMPINKKYHLKDLIDACDQFTEKTNKKISYEYVLIKDVNDSEDDARELSGLLKGKLAHVNLIVYNPHKFSDFKRPAPEVVMNFKMKSKHMVRMDESKIMINVNKNVFLMNQHKVIPFIVV